MGLCLVRLVEGVTFGEFALVVIKLGLLILVQDRVFESWVVCSVADDHLLGVFLGNLGCDPFRYTVWHSASY